ncbi:MAG: hypothetical protein KH352_07790, partial [Ruminococcus sp.]|nr:hypothetical protein [Candidatus Apopatosoma intestinale]
PRGDRRCLKEESIPLFVLFVLFGQAKRTLKEKKHKESFFLIVLLYDQEEGSGWRSHLWTASPRRGIVGLVCALTG